MVESTEEVTADSELHCPPQNERDSCWWWLCCCCCCCWDERWGCVLGSEGWTRRGRRVDGGGRAVIVPAGAQVVACREAWGSGWRCGE